jgi:hypothetical protein
MTVRRSAVLLRVGLPLLVCCITALLYWPGLHGPFLLDDIPNLEPLKRWMDGELDWYGVVFDNRSGPLGRPLSMATFLLNAMLAGHMDSFAFKPTNLLVHLLCGLVIWQLLRQLLKRDGNTFENAEWLALLVATLWLWLPLQVSTVLYVIQRMAQLAALFMLLALWVYAIGRRRIVEGRRSGWVFIWLGVPLLTLLAALSKENGILALQLALVLELTLYAPASGEKRPRTITLFFAITVVLPAMLALAWLAWNPGYILNGYSLRDFTLKERLLTEPRILWSYVQTLLFPIGRDMGIYHDNYPVSTGLFHPWTTLPAMLAWFAVAVAGWRLRKRAPLFSAGIGFFLVGHAIESGIIALELYFEHRNYLPSVGLLMAIAGGLSALLRNRPTSTAAFRHTGIVLLGLFPVLYAAGTWAHVSGWSSDRLFYAMQESYNPESPRLESNLAARAMTAGDLKDALRHISIGERYSPSTERITATIWRFLAYCATKSTPPASLYAEFESNAHGAISNFAMLGWEQLAGRIEHGCPELDLARLAQYGQVWLAQDPETPRLQNQWRTRYNLARIQAASGDLVTAEATDHQAWKDSAYNNGVGVLLFQLNASLGRPEVCRKILMRLEKAAHGGDYRLNKAVMAFRAALDAGVIKATATSGQPTRIEQGNQAPVREKLH